MPLAPPTMSCPPPPPLDLLSWSGKGCGQERVDDTEATVTASGCAHQLTPCSPCHTLLLNLGLFPLVCRWEGG